MFDWKQFTAMKEAVITYWLVVIFNGTKEQMSLLSFPSTRGSFLPHHLFLFPVTVCVKSPPTPQRLFPNHLQFIKFSCASSSVVSHIHLLLILFSTSQSELYLAVPDPEAHCVSTFSCLSWHITWNCPIFFFFSFLFFFFWSEPLSRGGAWRFASVAWSALCLKVSTLKAACTSPLLSHSKVI